MKIKTIHYSRNFVKKWKKLLLQEKDRFRAREKIFRQDCFDERLKTHKLKGRLSHLWSFSVDFKKRVLFGFKKEGVVLFYDFGSHQIYR